MSGAPRVGIIKSSTLARLGTWSPDTVLAIKDEVERRGGDIDADDGMADQARADIQWMEKNQQRERRLPMPSRRK